MARINIEDDLESHHQFKNLLDAIGGDWDKALGMLVRFFRLAQRRYGKGEEILQEELQTAGLSVMVDSGWAVPFRQGFQAIEADKHFAWYAQRVSAAHEGGKARSSGHRDGHGRFIKESSRTRAGHQPTVGKSPAGNHPVTSPPTPTPTPTPTQKLRTKGEVAKRDSHTQELKVQDPEDSAGRKAAAFIVTYVKAYQAKFGAKTRPPLTGKHQGMIKRFVSETPLERACALIQVYFQMPDPWFEKKSYDLGTFLENLDKIGIALDTGDIPGKPKKTSIEEILASEGGS